MYEFSPIANQVSWAATRELGLIAWTAENEIWGPWPLFFARRGSGMEYSKIGLDRCVLQIDSSSKHNLSLLLRLWDIWLEFTRKQTPVIREHTGSRTIRLNTSCIVRYNHHLNLSEHLSSGLPCWHRSRLMCTEMYLPHPASWED